MSSKGLSCHSPRCLPSSKRCRAWRRRGSHGSLQAWLPLRLLRFCRHPALRRPHSETRRSGLNEEVSSLGPPPPAAGPCQFMTKAGLPCRNDGRHWTDGRWSCSRNHLTA
jgi:hypothetical protein